MPRVSVEASAEIAASAAVVYGIISDYREGHPAILPPRYFTGLEVEEGGRGAGTVIRFGMKVMGRTQESRAEVAEPEPGRVLTERVLDDRDLLTTFTVEPLGPGRSRTTIATTWRARGIGGFVERLLAPGLLRRVYAAELALLDEAARRRGDLPVPGIP